MFYHEQRKIRIVVHGDDFTVLGASKELDWFHEVQRKIRDREAGAVRILNRIVTVTERGLEYEADQRHAEIMVNNLGLSLECRGVVTPGVSEKEAEGAEEAGAVD